MSFCCGLRNPAQKICFNELPQRKRCGILFCKSSYIREIQILSSFIIINIEQRGEAGVMFHLYTFQSPQSRYYVCEKTWKAARNTVLKALGNKKMKITDISGKRLISNCSNVAGIIAPEVALSEMAWWKCRCGSSSFIPINGGRSCRCVQCGAETGLHFAP